MEELTEKQIEAIEWIINRIQKEQNRYWLKWQLAYAGFLAVLVIAVFTYVYFFLDKSK